MQTTPKITKPIRSRRAAELKFGKLVRIALLVKIVLTASFVGIAGSTNKFACVMQYQVAPHPIVTAQLVKLLQ
jgi:hypothetical protein